MDDRTGSGLKRLLGRIRPPRRASTRDLRWFGLLLGAVGLALGGYGVGVWFGAAGVIFVLAASLKPKTLAPVFYVWVVLGELLGWAMSRIVLTVLFLGVVTPLGCISRLCSKKRSTARESSFWLPRDEVAPAECERQY